MRRYFYGWQRNWSETSWRAEEIVDVPPDKVVIDSVLALRGLRSTTWVEHRWGHVFEVRGGKFIRQDGYDTWEEALEAVGLRE
ncbi:MAG TPA: hypothetical protein VNT54_11080 [Solirubrobacteraceae bacterium]|nr:hypothetical protein [Solirubrobacteraceae bacterium]